MKAILRGIRITPKKANLVAGMIRGMPVKEALSLLKFMPKKGAKIVHKVLTSAVANAKNNFHQSADDLIVNQIWAVKGVTLKRATPANRGRAWPILERTSHITIELGLAEGVTPKKPVAKSEAKAAKAEDKVSKSDEKVAEKTKSTPAKKAAKKETKSSK
jgi:large subunit ribosomal protein L22